MEAKLNENKTISIRPNASNIAEVIIMKELVNKKFVRISDVMKDSGWIEIEFYNEEEK